MSRWDSYNNKPARLSVPSGLGFLRSLLLSPTSAYGGQTRTPGGNLVSSTSPGTYGRIAVVDDCRFAVEDRSATWIQIRSSGLRL